ncbi:MAG: radical family heme chaperone HemW [Bacteroidota bacterium]
MVESICREIELKSKQNPLSDLTIETLYFGGGTPSLLSPKELNQIFEKIHTHFSLSPKAEITIETNPDDINESTLFEWRKTGVNRLSIGIQSFFEEELKWMNRAHDAQQAYACIPLAQDLGFENITADLIFGSPVQSMEMLEVNLRTMIDMGIPHLSCYAMTVEPQTALHHKIKTGESKDVDADRQAAFFFRVMDQLQNAGFNHYEISNYAKPGFESKHNSNYWKGVPYFGFGPSAHSFDGKRTRSWNAANNIVYMNELASSKIPEEKEILDETQSLNEFIMIRLRTQEGLDLKTVEEKYGDKKRAELQSNMQRFLLKGHLIESEPERYVLSREGKLYADGIAAELFW